MTLKRWLPTFLAFPLGGLLAVETLGSLSSPAAAAVGGLLSGAVIGAGQWLALRGEGISRRWIAHTAVGMSAGLALAATLTDSGTELRDLLATGLLAGAAVGAAQAPLLDRGRAAWAALVPASWVLGWLVTCSIGVDVERGYTVFGSSGAILVTLLTGLALRARMA